MNDPIVGRIVHYHLRDSDLPVNGLKVGDPQPAIVVRVWGQGQCALNLHVMLDGEATKWKTSTAYGEKPGQWSWPPIGQPYPETLK